MGKIFSFFTLLILVSCSNADLENSGSKSKVPPPNILWIVAEDLSEYMPPFGDSTISTPTLSRLAAEGVCYDNFYSPAAVCSPARSAIATGMYPTRLGSNHMRTGPWYARTLSDSIVKRYAQFMPEGMVAYEAVPPVGAKMMSEYLRAAGYYCTNNSKQDYQFRCPITAWDENNNKGHWRGKKEGQPFFSIFNLNVTHESQIWARAKDSLWVDEDLKVTMPPYLPDTEVGRKDMRQMYSNVKQMDQQAGEILKQLEDDGLLDNTIIFWYSDHGGPLPRQKRLLYDSGIKVPLIIRFPDKANANTRNDDLLSFIDLAPTALSLAGIDPGNFIDGKAFLGEYSRTDKADYVYAAADRFDESYDSNRAVRDKRYKYIRYYEPEKPMFLHVNYRDQQPIMRELYRLRDEGLMTDAQALWFRDSKPSEELFDTWEDPHEINSLVADPKYKDKLEELRKACENWIVSTNDRCIKPEIELLAELWPDGVKPITKDPVASIKDGKLTIDCDTPGASLGYQLEGEDTWQVYSDSPVAVPSGTSLKVIAHKIGYVESKEILISS